MRTENSILSKPVVAALLASAALLLSGCATVAPNVETEVRSFAAATAQPVQPGTFRFDRAPSQEQNAEQAQRLETMALAALQSKGFTRNDAAARYSVQIGASTSNAVLVYPDPFFGRPFGYPFGRPRLWLHRPFYASSLMDRESFITQVRLEIRDIGTGKLVYESTATNEEAWYNPARVLPALFTAALADFPLPPQGVRKVIVQPPPAPANPR